MHAFLLLALVALAGVRPALPSESIPSIPDASAASLLDAAPAASPASAAASTPNPPPPPPPTPTPTPLLLIPEDADPQFEDEGAEWVPESELRRRMAAVAQERETERYRMEHAAKARALAERKRHAAAMADLAARSSGRAAPQPAPERSLQGAVDETPTPTPGPLYPVNPEDVAIALDEFGVPVTFAEVTPNRSTDSRPVVPLKAAAGCKAEAAAACAPQLSHCLGLDAENRELACACFRANGRCYRDVGCIELLPKETINFCFRRFYCPMDDCEGAGSAAVAVSALAAVLALAAVARAAAGPGAGDGEG
jgi:hypothetical protein